MRAHAFLAAAGAAWLLSACASVPPGGPDGGPGLEQRLADHVELLASDRLGGRAPGTSGERLTLSYLEEQWRNAGLKSGTHDPLHRWRAPFVVESAGGRPLVTHNLIGRIAGTDPQKGAVLLLAHWDHVGEKNAACPATGADRLCNGAIDNATGLAMITEIARAIAAGPRLARDVYVLATGAEERGLLGARAFADNPPVPLDRFVAAFNIDSEGLVPAGAPAVVIGADEAALGALVRQVAARERVALVDPAEANRLFRMRQDGWALEQAGVPAVMVSAAFADLALVTEWLAGSYHRPDDEAGAVELGAAQQMVGLHVALIRAAADPARYTPHSAAAPKSP